MIDGTTMLDAVPVHGIIRAGQRLSAHGTLASHRR